jgi:hypothetical protein
MSNNDNNINEATKKTIELLKQAVKDNVSGGGFEEKANFFRALFEPTENDNTAAGLIKTLNRADLEAAWQQVYKDEETKMHDTMKLAVQNDFVCQIHRDMQHRYSGRITRMLHETARKENHISEPNGAIQSIQSRIENFMALGEKFEE